MPLFFAVPPSAPPSHAAVSLTNIPPCTGDNSLTTTSARSTATGTPSMQDFNRRLNCRPGDTLPLIRPHL